MSYGVYSVTGLVGQIPWVSGTPWISEIQYFAGFLPLFARGGVLAGVLFHKVGDTHESRRIWTWERDIGNIDEQHTHPRPTRMSQTEFFDEGRNNSRTIMALDDWDALTEIFPTCSNPTRTLAARASQHDRNDGRNDSPEKMSQARFSFVTGVSGRLEAWKLPWNVFGGLVGQQRRETHLLHENDGKGTIPTTTFSIPPLFFLQQQTGFTHPA